MRDELGEFLDRIRFFRRRIHMADFLEKLVSALFVGVGAGILFQAAAFVLPFYYASLYTVSAVFLAAAAALAAALLKRCSMKEAALVMDSFGLQERIVTAYEHLGEEGELILLQRRDAMRQLQAKREQIRIPLCPSRRRLAALSGMLLLMLALILTPSAVKDQAKELHFVRRQAEEKLKEIEQALEGLQELEKQAEQQLTKEQLAALREMMDSLKSSASEYQQAASENALAAAGTKLEFKYGEMADKLTGLAGSLQGAAPSLAAARTAEELAELFQNMSALPVPGGGSTVADSGDGTGSGSKGSGGDGTGSGSEGTGGDGTGSSSEGSGGDGTGSGSEGSGGDESGDGAGSGSEGIGGDGTGSGSEGTGGDGEGGGSGDGAGSGSGGTGGDGAGSGSGGSGGDGTGSGSGGTGGDGTGSGSGRGEGSSSSIHDYVSVPNQVVDSGSLTGSAAGHEDSDYYRTQNGLSWEGERVSHEAVIGSYEKRAYEGISAGRYPVGMENVIKDYFSSFGSIKAD